MRNFQRLHVAVAALGALSLLGLSSALGRGLAPLSAIPVSLAAGTGSELAGDSLKSCSTYIVQSISHCVCFNQSPPFGSPRDPSAQGDCSRRGFYTHSTLLGACWTSARQQMMWECYLCLCLCLFVYTETLTG